MYIRMFKAICKPGLMYSDLFGQRISLREIVRVIGEFPLDEILDVSARIQVLVDKFPTDEDVQVALINGVADPADRIRLVRCLDDLRLDQKPILFHTRQLLVLNKLALRFASRFPKKTLFARGAASPLFRVLLGINQFMDEAHLTNFDNKPADWVEEFFAEWEIRNSLVQTRIGVSSDVQRVDKLLFEVPGRAGFNPRVDIKGLVESALASTVHQHRTTVFSMTAPVFEITKENFLDISTVWRDDKAVAIPVLKDESLVRVSERLYLDVGIPKLQVNLENPDLSYFFDFDCFRDRPFFRGREGSYCLSVIHAMELLSNRLLWLPAERLASERAVAYRGELARSFEDYVTSILLQRYGESLVFPGRKRCYRISPDENGWRQPFEYPDVMVLQPPHLFLFEVKSSILKRQTVTTGSLLHFDRMLEKNFIGATDGAGQIDRAWRHYEAGYWSPEGFPPGAFTSYYPIVVSLERFPHGKFVHDYIQRRISEIGILGSPAHPLTIMDIRELEAILASGRTPSLFELVPERIRNAPELSFHNFMSLFHREILEAAFDHYKVESDEVMRRAIRILPDGTEGQATDLPKEDGAARRVSAYFRWLDRGCPEDDAWDDWFSVGGE